MDQRSPEWFAARLGKVGASSIADMMAKTKTGYGASRENLMAKLIVERMTGQPTDGYTNAAMQWGIDEEPKARAAYEWETDSTVVEVGWVPHPEIDGAGASPDGLVGDDGLVEIKNPQTATHIDTLLTGKIPQKYVLQMQDQMSCTNRQWCDFVSFDSRLPPHLQLWIKRVERDQALIDKIDEELRTFLSEMNDKIEKLNERFPTGEQA